MDPKQRNQVIVAGVLVMVLLGLIVKTIGDVQRSRGGGRSAAASVPGSAAPSAAPSVPMSVLPQVTSGQRRAAMDERRKQLKWGDDPFVPRTQLYAPPPATTPGAAPSQGPNVKLTGIIYVGPREQNFALLNDRLIRQGQALAGVILRQVRPDGVVIEFQGKRHFLKLWEEIKPLPQP